MAGKHGKRSYYQVLLQPNRAALIDEIAKQKQVRSTELIRQLSAAMAPHLKPIPAPPKP